MDLTYFQTFREIVKCQSFTKAAEELGYAQSSVTAQIQKLEQAYGVPLFERFGRGMRLTAAGVALWELARPMLELYEESKETVGRHAAGNLSIGTIESLASFYLPPYLQQWQKAFPNNRLTLHTVEEASLYERVKEGSFDMGVLLSDAPPSRPLEGIRIRREPLLLVTKPGHPLSRIAEVTLHELNGESFIVAEEACLYRAAFIRLLKEGGVDYRIAFELGSLQAIKQCVLYGLGIALLPQISVAEELANGDLIALPFVHQDLTFDIQLVYHTKKWLSQSHVAFIDQLKQEGA